MSAPIVVATDLSVESTHALVAADALCQRTGAELVVCHIMPDDSQRVSMFFPQDFDPLPDEAELVAADRSVRDQVQAAIGREDVTLRLGRGVAAEMIAKLSDELSAALVVVGESEKGPVARAVIGSTTEDLAKIAPTSLLVVREGKRSGAVVAATDRRGEISPAAEVAQRYAEVTGTSVILVSAIDQATAAREHGASLIVVDRADENDDPVDIIRRAPCSVLVIRGRSDQPRGAVAWLAPR